MAQESSRSGKRKGRHPQNALSAAFVKNAKGPGMFADGNGLYLRVDESGARRWLQRIVIDGKRRDIAIGPVSITPLIEAREAAYNNRRFVRSGIDPRRSSLDNSAILSFEEASRTVHELHKPTWRNAKHAAQFISTLQTYAFPKIGNLKCSDVTSADIFSVLQPIWLEKPETARRVRQRMDRVLKWVIASGWRTDNPMLSIAEALPKQDKSKIQHRKSLPYSQVAECIEKIKVAKAYPQSKQAFECLVLTATRSGEVRLARKSEINLEKAIWIIPAERMKMRRDHSIPLSPRAVNVFRQALSIDDGSDLIFQSNRRGKPLSDATLLKLINSNGFDCHIHGFRASFRTWAQEQTNAPHEVAEAALAQVRGDKTEEAYMRSDLFDKRRMLMNDWADYLGRSNPLAEIP